jgi:guanylate kinase
MLVLSSPSGAGKTTLSRRLLESDDQVVMSVSATTRPRRPGEVEGKDYFFVDPPTFERMISEKAFLEHAHVFDHMYGTPAGPVLAALGDGQDVLFDIDWQGAQQLKQHAPQDLVSVFVLPPSLVELERRLTARAQDPLEAVRMRMRRASEEISHWPEYDYIIVNDDMEQSVTAISAILRAERLRRERQAGLVDFVKALQSDRN